MEYDINKPIKELDLVGFYCPIPVHELRKLLLNSDDGDIIDLICDDPETLHDIPALCNRMGITLQKVSEDAGEYTFRIINYIEN
ncbi:sulfurtransferase TusA family protein [Euryarchaeota archaeon]|nr:sulfurtransferase TusA family protein [Euryarchaeota archaeon]